MACQCIARVKELLLITRIEITTMAFTICSIASYFFWLEKPFQIEKQTHLAMPGVTMREILQKAGSVARLPYVDTPMDFVQGCGVEHGPGAWGRKKLFRTFGGVKMRPIRRIPDDYVPTPQNILLACFGWALAVIHCAIHVGGWNYSFPTPAE